MSCRCINTITRNLLYIAFLLCILSCSKKEDPIKWHNPNDISYSIIQNRAWSDEIENKFTRLPDRAKQSVRPEVWNLSRNSSGLSILFKSTADKIQISYIRGGCSLRNMNDIAVSGIDLYTISEPGDNIRINGIYNYKRGNNVEWTFEHTLPCDTNIFRLSLPLYDEVKELKIGLQDGEYFEWLPQDKSRPIVIYGTSIVQGASASHPSMAWTSLLQDKLDRPVVNLGFSGNAKMEKEVIQLLTEIDASLYVLDCLPNLDKENTINGIDTIVINAVKQLRLKSDTPILLIEHTGFSCNRSSKSHLERMIKANNSCRLAYDTLIRSGVDSLYYIKNEEICFPMHGWVDHVHPNDIGMYAIYEAVYKAITDNHIGINN